jgi:predicted MFS family arabinose efflux permease
MLGRVQGAYRAISSTGLLAGAALGGLLTSAAGLTAPLWLGLAASTMVIVLAWRPSGAPGPAGVSATAP